MSSRGQWISVVTLSVGVILLGIASWVVWNVPEGTVVTFINRRGTGTNNYGLWILYLPSAITIILGIYGIKKKQEMEKQISQVAWITLTILFILFEWLAITKAYENL
ncbi:hypothetical protein AB4Y30_04005 [Ornithinibacillus sp. 4-3]|uniref:DUF1648 domain-containing protein n=1 Tax=Ornithinibacillus sp. 4-3 TaxID=3231488 RepID=A0AB39HT56_9BACI